MQALMLAAGMGKRLGRYTKNATKCMVPVNGKTLIEYAIEALVKNNIKKMVIVVGYKSDVLINFIHSKFNKSNRYIKFRKHSTKCCHWGKHLQDRFRQWCFAESDASRRQNK